MENQPRQITGYRELSEKEVAAMKEVEAVRAQVGDLVTRLAKVPGVDPRAVALAKTELQTGFMWAVRAIAQPTTF